MSTNQTKAQRTNRTSIVVIVGCFWLTLFSLSTRAFGEILESAPEIKLISIPPLGREDDLKGTVSNVNPSDYAIVVLIRVNNQWWIKPQWDNPLTNIREDGSWTCDITTGGVDHKATEVAVFLVPRNYQPPVLAWNISIPEEIANNAVARKHVLRDASNTPSSQPISDTPSRSLPGRRIAGFCYGPFRQHESPDALVFPTINEIIADFEFIPKLTSTIRTYGCTSTLGSIPDICVTANIDCYLGAWLGPYREENEKEIESLLSIIQRKPASIKVLIVGNEVLLRKDLTEEELIGYIRRVKQATNIPVATADIWPIWQNHPRLAKEVDLIFAHMHPYWEGVPIEKAVENVVEHLNSLKRLFPDKRIAIGETGWPSAGEIYGEAVPSGGNQARFYKEFVGLAEAQGFEFLYFEIFDESYKGTSQHAVEASWGLYGIDGTIKSHMRDLLPQSAINGIKRPPRKLAPIKATVPLYVYRDAYAEENSFYPSGWMGDVDCIIYNDACPSNPYSGETCIEITYDIHRSSNIRVKANANGTTVVEHTSSASLWSGIYWQFPPRNWGDWPGYEFATGLSRLRFWARGQYGGEKAIFKCGGISDSHKPFKDSFGPIQEVVELTRDWTEYTIDISGQDASNLIGGFCWVTNLDAGMTSSHFVQNKSWTIYLDDIVLE